MRRAFNKHECTKCTFFYILARLDAPLNGSWIQNILLIDMPDDYVEKQRENLWKKYLIHLKYENWRIKKIQQKTNARSETILHKLLFYVKH